jgi:hypothetical protein
VSEKVSERVLSNNTLLIIAHTLTHSSLITHHSSPHLSLTLAFSSSHQQRPKQNMMEEQKLKCTKKQEDEKNGKNNTM